MTSIFKLEDVVLKVSLEAKLLVPKVPRLTKECDLFSELVLCILSSQEKYEAALASMKVLKEINALEIPRDKCELSNLEFKIANLLRTPVIFIFNKKKHQRRIRFFKKKTSFIMKTIENIYMNGLTINKIVSAYTCYNTTRNEIIKHSCGLGPKQASMFLRNIGYHSEFAVLDKHVISYMKLMGLVSSCPLYSSISSYQKIERILRSYAALNKMSLLHLDLGIWTTMRALKNIQE